MLIPILMTIVVIILIYLLIIVFFPIFKEAQSTAKARQPEDGRVFQSGEEVEFTVEGDRVAGWLFLPEKPEDKIPGVILSHGFGGVTDIIMEGYALAFANAGYAALCYDFRHFGESQGQPRQLYMAKKQIVDLKAAIAYIRNRPEVDPDRIVLWGTSAAGGYGLEIAAEDDRIAGLIAQCPALDKDIDSRLALEREGWGFFLKLFVHAQRDRGRGRLGLSPHYIQIVGHPGDAAMITAPGAYEGYMELTKDAMNFDNRVCAQVLITGQGENPVDFADKVHCPMLILQCEKDNLVSPASVDRVKKAMGDSCRVKSYPIGHFEIYQGEDLDQAMTDMVEFLKTL
jgi:hypothetical protein